MSGTPLRAARAGPALAAVVLSAATLLGVPAGAEAQATGARGLQLEAAGLGTTLLGGAFPNDETGLGATLGVHHRWPGGLSLGVVGLHAQPEDLDLPSGDRRRTMSQWGVYTELRYRLNRPATVRPYLGARAGWTRLDAESDPEGVADGTGYSLVAGVETWPTDRLSVRAGATAGVVTASGFFGPDETTSAGTWSFELGASVFLGDVRRDGDRDGVRDAEDVCPDTPAGVSVREDGCAVDADRDGVPDHRDACAGTPAGARVDGRGCPTDGDGDGVHDGLDACPDTADGVPVDEEGCVRDADADGVHDRRDACPGTPEGVGVDEDGCPADADGDGVVDRVDACPDTQYRDVVDDEGCSEVERSLQESGRFTLPGLPLDLDAVRLRGPSRDILGDVGRQLAARPEAVLEVRVFPRTTGRPDYDRRLAQLLAEGIRDHLLSAHPSVEDDRVRAVGYGARPGPDADGDGGDRRRPRVDFVVVEPDG